jgi:hypothetical protein
MIHGVRQMHLGHLPCLARAYSVRNILAQILPTETSRSRHMYGRDQV